VIAWRYRLVGLAILLSIGCAQSPPSELDFRQVQESCCRELLKKLSRRVEWHLVVDRSLSFTGEKGRPERVLEKIIAAIPVEQGDSLCVDTFSKSYEQAEGECLKARVPGSNLANAVKVRFRQIVNRQGSTQVTDFVGLLGSLQEKVVGVAPQTPPREDPLLYYVVVTDGEHSPEDNNLIVPLFEERLNESGDPEKSFGGVLSLFRGALKQGGRVAALAFAIDSDGEGSHVTRDWEGGLASLSQSALESMDFFFVESDLHSEVGKYRLATLAKRQEVILPCMPATEQGEIPSYFACSDQPSQPLDSVVPASLFALGGGAMEVDIPFLYRDSRNVSGTIDMLSEHGAPHVLATSMVTVQTKPHSTIWRRENLSFALEYRDGELAGRDLPQIGYAQLAGWTLPRIKFSAPGSLVLGKFALENMRGLGLLGGMLFAVNLLLRIVNVRRRPIWLVSSLDGREPVSIYFGGEGIRYEDRGHVVKARPMSAPDLGGRRP